MSKIKLVGIHTNHIEEEHFGTCDICMYTAPFDEVTFEFELPDGKRLKAEGFQWSYGDVFEVDSIDNIGQFAAWLEEVEVPESFIEETRFGIEIPYHELDGLIREYKMEMEPYE